MTSTLEPYCGPAPDIQTLQYAWNFDPVLIAPMVLALGCLYRLRRGEGMGMTCLLAVLLVITFISPLCALSTALFSARTVHHILVASVAAPVAAALLLPLGRTLLKWPAQAAFLAHTIIYWAWHLPPTYEFALSGTPQYWVMQSALIASAVWLWMYILSGNVSVFTSVGLAVATMVQMGFLGAILTFAPHPLFAPHLLTTQLFGFTPLADQQLSGVLMWTLGFAPYVAAAVFVLRNRLLPSRPALGS